MRRALLSIGVVLGIPVIASTARAGQYDVQACSQAPASLNESWASFNSDPVHLQVGSVCPPSPGDAESTKTTGMYASDVLGSSGAAPDGSIAGWRFIAPAGTEIVGLQDDRYLGAYADHGWAPFVKADGVTLETCSFSAPEESCTVGDPFGAGSLNGNLPIAEAATLTVGVKCVAVGGCTTGATIHRAWAALYGAKVTLSAQAPPALEAESGGLWDASGHVKYHHGAEVVAFNATALTGIKQVLLTADGRALDSAEGNCDFARALPCESLTSTFSLNTSLLSDGAHTLALEAVDAAGNRGLVSESIAVANQPPPAPVRLTATPAGAGSFSVAWDDPPDPTPITSAVYQLCDATGSNCGPTTSGRDAPFTASPGAAGGMARVWLVDAAGNSNAANAALVSLPASAPPSGVQTPAVSSAQGSLRLRVRLRGKRLGVTVIGSHGVVGLARVDLEAVQKSGKHFGRRGARARLVHGVARLSFVLGPRTLRANRLVIRASAQHARATRKVFALQRAKAQAGIPPALLGH